MAHTTVNDGLWVNGFHTLTPVDHSVPNHGHERDLVAPVRHEPAPVAPEAAVAEDQADDTKPVKKAPRAKKA